MKIDSYGQHIYTEEDLCNLYYKDSTRIVYNVLVDSTVLFSDILELENTPNIIQYINPNKPIPDFDKQMQSTWFIPENYKNFDIAKYVLDLCNSDEELQRVGQELLMFHERDMFPLLIYLKYLVDTMREHNIVWGVGRGSSVASFVLFLIGVHRINSLYYDLPIDEFLK